MGKGTKTETEERYRQREVRNIEVTEKQDSDIYISI